jgi:hypothetical protein
MDLNETYARIGEYIKSRPSETYGQIGSTLGLGRSQIARIARLQGIKRRPGRRPSALEAAVAAMGTVSPKPDCAPAGEAAPPSEETVPAAPDAPPAEAAVL